MLRVVVFVLFFILSRAEAVPCKALTLNFGLLQILCRDYVPNVGARRKVIINEVPRFIRENGVDIFAHQELWHQRDRSEYKKQFDPDEYHLVSYAADRAMGIPLGNGLLLGVRREAFEVVPTVLPYFERFRDRAGLEGIVARKGYLVLELRHRSDPDLRLIVANTHLQNVDVTELGVSKDPKGEVAQGLQAEQLVQYVVKRSGMGELPILIGGDLNSGINFASRTYQFLTGRGGFFDPYLILSPPAPFVTWDPSNPLISNGDYSKTPPGLVDHWLFRNGKRVRIIPVRYQVVLKNNMASLGTPIADHYSLLYDFRLEKQH